ncbi:hypothetical protein EDD18DRAFT_1189718 [Armillaria luteobubalina]|uniref:AB hydrolase-1 domain-containing protein n=1 Tax=Armillaria luteobubalina TaxID=153913 RepID=A0AA39PS51_9AGAR|nr:hypothetical protein EDD18DRAFT_1189718 [Armillaria luteobubalina]
MDSTQYKLSLPSSTATFRANRYKPRHRTPTHAGTPGLVLVCAYGLPGVKELYEPILLRLFAHDEHNRLAGSPLQIIEAWAVDAPEGEDSDTMSYAHALAALRQSIFLSHVDAYGGMHRVILIGWGDGANACILSSDFFPPGDPSPYEGMILVDPAIYDDGDAPHIPAPLNLEWDSPEDAHVYLSSHEPWASWDSWTRDIFVNNSLIRLPDNGVALKRTYQSGKYSSAPLSFLSCHVPFSWVVWSKSPRLTQFPFAGTKFSDGGVYESPVKVANAIYAALEGMGEMYDMIVPVEGKL